jgi:chaperonin cofactor prefoldin
MYSSNITTTSANPSSQNREERLEQIKLALIRNSLRPTRLQRLRVALIEQRDARDEVEKMADDSVYYRVGWRINRR